MTTKFNTKQGAMPISGTSGQVPVKQSSTDGDVIYQDPPTGSQTLTGEATGTGAGTISVTLANVAVIAKVLTGYTPGAGTVTGADSILSSIQKLAGNINLLSGAIVFQGTWNATTNTPTLTSSVGTKGYLYKVAVAGTTNLDGISSWNVGDSAVFNGTTWDKIDGLATEVLSVNGHTGAVSLSTADIAEVTNLYFTNALAIASVLTGYGSGAGTITATDTILQAIQKLNGNTSAIGNPARIIQTITPSATPTINTDVTSVVYMTGLNTNVTSFTTNLTGTPANTNGNNELIFDITDDGTPRTLAFGSKYEATTLALPTTTVAGVRLQMKFRWNVVTSKWTIVALV